MNLVSCSDCGEKISYNAVLCPHCGKQYGLIRVDRSGWSITVALGTVLGGIIVGIITFALMFAFMLFIAGGIASLSQPQRPTYTR